SLLIFFLSSLIGRALAIDFPIVSAELDCFRKKAATSARNKKPVPTRKARLIPSSVAWLIIASVGLSILFTVIFVYVCITVIRSAIPIEPLTWFSMLLSDEPCGVRCDGSEFIPLVITGVLTIVIPSARTI